MTPTSTALIGSVSRSARAPAIITVARIVALLKAIVRMMFTTKLPSAHFAMSMVSWMWSGQTSQII